MVPPCSLRRRIGSGSAVLLAPLLLLLSLSLLLTVHPAQANAAEPYEQLSRRSDVLSAQELAERAAIGDRPANYLPAKRSYDTHLYYAMEVRSDYAHLDVRELVELLDAELVERVGELKDHWLIRREKPFEEEEVPEEGQAEQKRALKKRREVPHSEDVVLRRWQELSRRRSLPTSYSGLEKRTQSLALAIRNVERQELRKRHKRSTIYNPLEQRHLYPNIRAPMPGPYPHPYPDPLPRPPPIPNAKSAEMMGQFDIRDPIFGQQWHLANDKMSANDLNISAVWAQGVKGKGVNICLIDDGLDHKSPDLADNFFAAGSYDFNDHVDLPTPRHSDDQHGTRCAGEIAAIRNDVCGIGVAHEAHVAGVRILSGPITDVDEAAALNYRYQENHIYSCSWGPPDDGRSMDAPKGLIAKAMLNGIVNGRDGKGSIFVFAGGNGGASDDQCNFDGYTNSIFSMTIAAVDREGLHPYYSEMCSATIATGWSSGSGDHIHTTDVAWQGVNRCTANHGGTSAAAPLVAGVVALALSVRPDLTWRDVQHITVHSAQMVNPDDKDWQKTQAGRPYNHKYGFGVVDAYQFVEEARRHKLVNAQAWAESPNVTVAHDQTLISREGVKSTFVVTSDWLKKNNLASLEHITVRVWISHQRRGDVDVELTSPHGTRSVLARARRYDDAKTGFPGWGFMTLKHWDEDPVGTWTLEVFDRDHPKQTGNFWAWSMTLWGASIDPSKAKAWNFPTDSLEYMETLSGAPTATSLYLSPGQATQRPKKPDHLPDDHGTRPGESDVDFTNGRPKPSSNPEADTGYLTGLKDHSTWLFVATGVVLIFGSSLGAFFLIRRRRAARRGGIGDAAAYEFVPGEDDEMAMSTMQRGGASSARGAAGAKGGARRTKELYDAFGEATDEEDDDEDAALVGSGRGAAQQQRQASYRDEPEEDSRFAIGADDAMTPVTAEQPRESKEADLLFDASADGEGSGGSGEGSWQDAVAESKE